MLSLRHRRPYSPFQRNEEAVAAHYGVELREGTDSSQRGKSTFDVWWIENSIYRFNA